MSDQFNFRLKIYPNPMMRDDGVFVVLVAEDRPVPQDGYSIPGQLPVDFAIELVARWNAAGPKEKSDA